MARSDKTEISVQVALRRVLAAHKAKQSEKQEDKPNLKIAYWEAGGVYGTADNVNEAGRKAGTWAAVRRAQESSQGGLLLIGACREFGIPVPEYTRCVRVN